MNNNVDIEKPNTEQQAGELTSSSTVSPEAQSEAKPIRAKNMIIISILSIFALFFVLVQLNKFGFSPQKSQQPTSQTHYLYQFDISPDETKIALPVATSYEATPDIYLGNIDGSEYKKLPLSGYATTFSHDGKKLFVRNTSTEKGLTYAIYDLESEAVSALAISPPNKERKIGDAVWSHDNSRIYYSAYTLTSDKGQSLGHDIFSIKADGTELTQLTHFTDNRQIRGLTLSPDDMYVFIATTVSGNFGETQLLRISVNDPTDVKEGYSDNGKNEADAPGVWEVSFAQNADTVIFRGNYMSDTIKRFAYELYSYNFNTDTMTPITHLDSTIMRAVEFKNKKIVLSHTYSGIANKLDLFDPTTGIAQEIPLPNLEPLSSE